MEINLNYIYQHKILMFEGKNYGEKKKKSLEAVVSLVIHV